jgi:hypothetical protein
MVACVRGRNQYSMMMTSPTSSMLEPELETRKGERLHEEDDGDVLL